MAKYILILGALLRMIAISNLHVHLLRHADQSRVVIRGAVFTILCRGIADQVVIAVRGIHGIVLQPLYPITIIMRVTNLAIVIITLISPSQVPPGVSDAAEVLDGADAFPRQENSSGSPPLQRMEVFPNARQSLQT